MCERFAKSHAFTEVKNLSACSDFEIYDMSAASYANLRAETNQRELLERLPMWAPHYMVSFSAFVLISGLMKNIKSLSLSLSFSPSPYLSVSLSNSGSPNTPL